MSDHEELEEEISIENEKINKKYSIRKILKEVVEKEFHKANELIKSNVKDKTEGLKSIAEVLKRKSAAIKTLEEEIVELENNHENIAQIIDDGTTFEIECKTKLNQIYKFINEGKLEIEDEKFTAKGMNTVNLPQFQISKFAGDPTQWQSFYDSFQAAVGKLKNLSGIEKFNYLRCFLEGEPLHAIHGFQLTNENYKEAMELLKNRYGDSQKIIAAHMNALVRMSCVDNTDIGRLRKFYDDVTSHVRSLVNLGVESKTYGSLLCPVILEKLPNELRLIISRNNSADNNWDFTRILELINVELKAREALLVPSHTKVEGKNDLGLPYSPFTGSSLYTGVSTNSDRKSHEMGSKGGSSEGFKRKCVFCEGNHWSDKCNVVTDVQARKDMLKKANRCFMCLKTDHISRNCQKTKPCFYCKKLHNSAICSEKTNRGTKAATNYAANISSVFLQTAEIEIENPENKKQVKIKCLLDPGAQMSFLTDRVKNALNLKPISEENSLVNVFLSKKYEKMKSDKVSINLKRNSKNDFNMEILCKPFICLPIANQPIEHAQKNYEFLKDLNLADSKTMGEIDLLIGSDFYWSLVTGKIKRGKEEDLVAIETDFGWVLNGPINEKIANTHVALVHEAPAHVMNVCCEPTKIECLENDLNKLWDLETLGIKQNEKPNYDRFIENIKQNDEKRYETTLPFKETHPLIYDHFDLCEKRLKQLFTKLKGDEELLKKYNDVFEEQLKLGIIEEAPEESEVGECHYLPHHAVFREERTTTKLRVVFDASASSEGPSLNDCLYKGPQLTPLIFDILHRFRTYEVALTSDIEKAFLQISIDPKERDFLRFLWYDDVFSDSPRLKRLRFARMTIGLTSSPFLLNGSIEKHMKKYQFDKPFIEKVKNSFYVDDFSGGDDSFENCFELFKKLKLRFAEGFFNLRKWRTNNEKLRKLISENINEINPQKILGVLWDEINDTLIFDFFEICKLSKTLLPTKRNILKILAMFFDPIGVLQPLIINLKILFQKVCKEKFDWDQEISQELKGEWEMIINSIESAGKIQIPRKITTQNDSENNNVEKIELHGFSDASYQNYGACIYLKTFFKSGEISVHLITSKSRLAPIKGTTIPRLELLGNLLLSRLMNSVEKALSKVLKISESYFWTDSQITLAWIGAHEKEFQTFIENRVQEIRKLTNVKSWFYCNTKNNPADLLTRLQKIEDFQNCKKWWFGPEFLHEKTINYNLKVSSNRDKTPDELKASVLVENQIDSGVSFENVIEIKRFNSLLKLLKVTAWVHRFIKNLKNKLKNKEILLKPFITGTELQNVQSKWIKENQKSFDKNKLNKLNKELKIFCDENGLLRCEGRLKNAPLPLEAKRPILINSEHDLAKLIVNYIHTKHKHISIKQTLTELRQNYWICRGRQFVRKIIRNCFICKKYEGPSYQYPVTPPLTKHRLNDEFAFHTTGVDNFGPLFVKNIFYTKTDNSTLFKVWVTLYTCAGTRGILLDIVPYIDAPSFIRCFRRFVSRRGCPSYMISDGGKNFVSRETQTFVNSLGVDWKVNMPLAPWHGGFFERMVRTTKTILRKTLETAKLTYEELQTILHEVEQIVNNRPITYYYSDNEEACLTPNHLLYGRTLNNSNLLSASTTQEIIHPKKLESLINHFWERWKKEYVVNLREHQKIMSPNENRCKIELNDVVIVEEELVPRSAWRLGKVEGLIKGDDGQIRGAKVKVAKTKRVIQRPVNKLYPVECTKNNVNILEKDNINFKKDNIETENKNDRTVNMDSDHKATLNIRPKRNAAIVGELKRKYLQET